MAAITGCTICVAAIEPCPENQHLDTVTGLCVEDTNWLKWIAYATAAVAVVTLIKKGGKQ